MSAPTPIIPAERFEIFANGLDHPECVAFDREGNLWAGGESGQVYRIDRTGQVEQVAYLGGFSAGLAFSPSGQLFVCNPTHGIVRIDLDSDESFGDEPQHETFASPAGNHKLISPNFIVFGRSGMAYFTDSGRWQKRNGMLARWTPGDTGEVIAGPFGYANGLALTADERMLFMVESDTHRVYRFDIAPDGRIGSPEVFAENVGRFPDGLVLDEAGNLYVSCYASDDIYRISPIGEKTLFAYDPFAILLSRPTNMAFWDEWMYVANLGRTTVTRAKVGVRGQKLVNLR